MFDHEVVLALIPILPTFLQVRHIKSRQDKVKGKDNLTLPEQVNSIADELADTYTTTPKQYHIQSTYRYFILHGIIYKISKHD